MKKVILVFMILFVISSGNFAAAVPCFAAGAVSGPDSEGMYHLYGPDYDDQALKNLNFLAYRLPNFIQSEGGIKSAPERAAIAKICSDDIPKLLRQRFGDIVLNVRTVTQALNRGVEISQNVSYESLCGNYFYTLTSMPREDITKFFLVLRSYIPAGQMNNDISKIDGNSVFYDWYEDDGDTLSSMWVFGAIAHNLRNVKPMAYDGKYVFWHKAKIEMLIDLMSSGDLGKYTNSKLATVLYKQLQDGLKNFEKIKEINDALRGQTMKTLIVGVMVVLVMAGASQTTGQAATPTEKKAAAGEKIRRLVWDDESNKYIPKEEADAKWKASNWCKAVRYTLSDVPAIVKETEHGDSFVGIKSEIISCKNVAEDMQQRYGDIIFNLTQILPSKDYVQKTRGISYATLCRNFKGNLARMSYDDIATFFFIFGSSFDKNFETGDEPYFGLFPDGIEPSVTKRGPGYLMYYIADKIAKAEDKPEKIFWIKFKLNMLLDMLKGQDIQKYTRSKRGEAILKFFKEGCVDE